ncbi:hypothetical protein J5J83_22200 [Azoarcus sp. L1K30]|uniref:hypothetical protein n=1 Tax=Azoarcus sp. L1K30 TaxID=2820277 RepID=UPI001B82E786|nr:hypothetical protein [Azoarcus sp. L1K30]MBR0568847.1 hypothetical protein [Azoarcus sp. L1K30]
MFESEQSSEPLDAALAWLAAEPDDNPVADLEAFRRHEAVAGDAGLSVAHREAVLVQLQGRAKDICGRFRPRLLTASLPLDREIHQPAMALIGSLLVIGEHYRALVVELRRSWLPARRDEMVGLCGKALDLLGEACALTAMAGAAVPAGFWRLAHQLWLVSGAGELPEEGADEPGVRMLNTQYRRLLTIAVSQYESLTAREVQWLFDYLECAAANASLSAQPIQPDNAAYWIDPEQDLPPASVARHGAPPGRQGMYFSPQDLARRMGEQIEWLEERVLEAEIVGMERDGELLDPEVSGLPEGLTPVELLSLLRRLRERWVSPPQRTQPRRKHQYTVQVCAGLKTIWEVGRGGSDKVSEWMVFNESPGGYAILCVGGIDAALSAGMLLALRRESTLGWSVCVVRWIRTEKPDQVELGLQVVSQGFTSVMVGFRGSEVRALSPALMLPPLALVRQHQALVTGAGTYVSRRFVLVHDAERLYVAQGRVLGLDMQTANIELLRYEVDPYPI